MGGEKAKQTLFLSLHSFPRPKQKTIHIERA